MFKNIFSTLKNYQYNHINIRLILYVILITCVGILAIGSAASADYQEKQTLGFIFGLVMMIIVSLISYKWIMKLYWLIYFANIVLLLTVTFFGALHNGAERWINLGFFQFQPSEFTKVLLLLFMAMYIQKHSENINTLKVLGGYIILCILPLALIFTQPDLSTTVVIFLTLCVIIYTSGISYKIVLGVFIALIPTAIILVYLVMQPNQSILEEYQYNRIIGFYQSDNEAAEAIRYQQENSILAIGSGGLTGKGLNNNTVTSVKNGNFLSEPHTDFIFTIIGEELGFIGCAAVILLLLLITIECFWVGYNASDISGRVFAYGFGSLIAIQSFVNIAVATMLIPNTGLTLPFVSYGLSSLISLFIGIGVVLNIGMQRKRNIYEEVKY